AANPGAGSNPPRLEVLVPVLSSSVPQPVAGYQVVSDLSDLAPALSRLTWSVLVSVILGVLMLYAALFTIVRKSSGDLERQEWALHRSFIGIIRSLINALDARDMATAHHSSRVADNAVLIAQAMGLDEVAVSEVLSPPESLPWPTRLRRLPLIVRTGPRERQPRPWRRSSAAPARSLTPPSYRRSSGYGENSIELRLKCA